MQSFLVIITKKHLGIKRIPFKSLPFGSESHAWHVQEMKTMEEEEEEERNMACCVLSLSSPLKHRRAPRKWAAATKQCLRLLCPNRSKRRHGRLFSVEGKRERKEEKKKLKEFGSDWCSGGRRSFHVQQTQRRSKVGECDSLCPSSGGGRPEHTKSVQVQLPEDQDTV